MSIDNRNNWLHFVSRSSDCGADWIRVFRERLKDHKDMGFRAVACFQGHQYQKGLDFLNDFKKVFREAPEGGVMDLVISRWYYAALAYYHYCTDHYDEALTCLDLAMHSLELAIEERPFLVTLAGSGEEFCLHKARVARNLRRWKEMENLIEVARAMVDGTGPLCCLPSGRAITFQDIKDFYFSIPDLTNEENASLRYVFNDAFRLSRFEEHVGNMYVLPGFVVVH